MQNVNTIRDFVTCIKELENDSYDKLFNLERRGIRKSEPILNSDKCYDSQNINNNNNKPQEINKISCSSNQKSKKMSSLSKIKFLPRVNLEINQKNVRTAIQYRKI